MKLKVGDIEMDSQAGITFTEARRVGVSPDAIVVTRTIESSHTVVPAAPPRPEERSLGEQIDAALPPWRPSTFGALGVVAAGLAAGAAALFLPPYLRDQPLGALLVLTVPFSLASVTNFAAAAYARRRALRPRPVDPAVAARGADVLKTLLATDTALRVEDVATSLHCKPAEAAAALVMLVQEGKVDEDVDVDSGAWHYRASDSARVPAQLKTPEPGRRAADVVDEDG